ncbi:MAG: amidase [Deltaproteobacteria bacterium]|jgi:Asp-tRNA(Asn)/Glu-tRNA(Gln) amidotransferase A subunit family amidase|nr:amidase [Deltaproteobacteria bacterium]MBT6856770.1 amidase [Nitrospina sp.]
MPEIFDSVLDTDSPLFWPIVSLNEAYRRGDLSPVEVLEEAVVRAEAFNPSLNAYLERLDEQARQQAKVAEKLFMNSKKDIPLLCGVPLSIKDTFELAGSVTTYGSEFFQENLTQFDSGLVRRLRETGAVFTGKTNTPEFGQSATTENRLGGDARNPWGISLTPGGSSGGAAASVGAGLATAAIGADGGGSIRIPAAFTGLFGIKPTYGLCVNENGFRAMSDFIAPGPLTRCVEDARIILEVLAGCRYRPRSLNRRKFRIAWSPRPENHPVDAGVAKILGEAVEKISMLGHEIEETKLPLEGWNESFDTLVLAEEYRERGHLLEPATEHRLTSYERKSLQAGKKIMEGNPQAVKNACNAHREYQQRLQEYFKKFDLIITPATATTAFPLGKRPLMIDGQQVNWLWGAVPFTAPFNVSGNPAASIPCGFSEGLPIGLQLVGHRNSEEMLLNFLEDLEELFAFDDTPLRKKWTLKDKE